MNPQTLLDFAALADAWLKEGLSPEDVHARLVFIFLAQAIEARQ